MQDSTNAHTGKNRPLGTPAAAPATTVIGANARINGDIVLDGDASILGKVEGRLEVGGQLHVGDDATVTAEVFCDTLNLEGSVRGDVVASGGVTLGTDASLLGDVAAGHITIPAGATCQGSFVIGPNAAQQAAERRKAVKSAPATDNRKSGGATTELKLNGAKDAAPALVANG